MEFVYKIYYKKSNCNLKKNFKYLEKEKLSTFVEINTMSKFLMYYIKKNSKHHK